ncbi:MAG: hypothetical protein RJB62_1593 [Pseudomonadota bacterium]
MERITPQTEAELSDAVRDAALNRLCFEIVSGGTKRSYGRVTEADRLLDLSHFSGMQTYEPDELIFTARAATPIAEIEATLSARRQMLAFAPADWGPLFGEKSGSATLAGVAAANACGSRRFKSGAVRDHLIGCRFVNGDGEAIKAGGRVVKNVTGFDLPKLLCGAFGTLGALTEMTFRVVPALSRAPAIAIRDCHADEGLSLLRKAAGLPFEATGLAYLPAQLCALSTALHAAHLSQANGVALIRIEGAEDPVIDKIARLRDIFSKQNLAVLEDDVTSALFTEIGNGTPFRQHNSDIWRLFVPSTKAYEALAESEASFWYADWAGEVLWLGLPASREMDERLRKITAKFGGSAMLMRASSQARSRLSVFEPQTLARAALNRAVKTAFDPMHLFNPGRMYEDV